MQLLSLRTSKFQRQSAQLALRSAHHHQDVLHDLVRDLALCRRVAILHIFSILVSRRHPRPLFPWVHLPLRLGVHHRYSLPLLLLFSWSLVPLRLGVHLRCSLPASLIRLFRRLDPFDHLRSIRRPSSLSACSRCCTNASSSRCMSSSIRAVHSSECGFVTLCAPRARATQASHPGVGPYRATSCFRMYVRLCCGALTTASGAGITLAGTGGGLASGSGSPPVSIHGTPRHFRMNSLSHWWSAVFR